MTERDRIVLRVDYDDPDDLIAEYDETLCHGSTWVAYQRLLDEGTTLELALSFNGLIAPIHVDGVVQSTRGGDEPMLLIQLVDGPSREQLGSAISRIRAGDPALVRRILRVLVVEDNRHVSDLICHGMGDHIRGLSRDATLTIKTACDGREALALLGEQQFDAMIVDVYLPVLDGARLITTLRGQPQHAKLPIIAISAGGDPAHHAAMTAGADHFIEKPMRLRNMIEVIRTLTSLGGAS
jgi:CheY-like chemotaxis protein